MKKSEEKKKRRPRDSRGSIFRPYFADPEKNCCRKAKTRKKTERLRKKKAKNANQSNSRAILAVSGEGTMKAKGAEYEKGEARERKK